MTAEIAIMNKSGIALAADSKVTISGGGSFKTFDTVNKLFTLSKIHPIGVMIWGNGEFMGYPFELICKQYRAQKGAKSEPTVEDWAKDFVGFLKRFGREDIDQTNENIFNVVVSWFEHIQRSSGAEARRTDVARNSLEFNSILKKRLKIETDAALRRNTIISEQDFSKIIDQHASPIQAALDEFFNPDDHELKQLASEFTTAVLLKEVFSPRATGFVVAGYGDNELFPALSQFQTDGYIGPVLKVASTGQAKIARDQPGGVFPFAQKEMVERFMEGVDPGYSEFVEQLYRNVMMENCVEVLEKYGIDSRKTDDVKAEIRAAVAASVIEAQGKLGKFQRQQFIEPIIQMVTMLPKDELPHLAESLVALTSLKRHVSQDAETVGGPIDVALISKDDGFIWIKRKHYFKPELNPQFVQNYFRVTDGAKNEQPKRSSRSRSRTSKGSGEKQG